MLYDGQFQALDFQINGLEDHLEIAIFEGAALPTGQGAIPLLLGIRRYPLGRENALKIAEALKKAAEDLPEEKPPSDLVVAQSLSGVEQAAKQQETIKKGNQRPRR